MKLIRLLVLLALVAGAALFFGDRVGAGASGSPWDALAEYNPCEQPLTWRVGTVDPRFGISREAVAEAVRAAVRAWEEPTGLDLFRHDPEGEMPVHLNFDSRQQAFLEDEGRRGELRALEEEVTRAQAAYDRAQEAYERAAEEGRRRAAEVSARVSDFNRRVAAWNSQGGAPPEEHERLQAEGAQLERDQQELRRHAAQLDDMGMALEADARRLEQAAERYNARVDALAAESPGRLVNSATFQIETVERLGRRTEVRRWINVFQFQNEEHLVFLVAHELGHALALDHVADPLAIMREEHTMDQLTGTVRAQPADLAALMERCGA